MIRGKHIVITGKLLFYKRKDAFDQIICRGGIPQSSVTVDTDYLVIGYYREGILTGDKSNKRIRAEKYAAQGKKVKLISHEEFMVMLWNSPLIET